MIPIFEVPPASIVNDLLEFLPFKVFLLPNNHILVVKLMATVGYSFIVQLMSVFSKSLDLVALLAPVDSIGEDITIVRLIALAPEQWTHLVTP